MPQGIPQAYKSSKIPSVKEQMEDLTHARKEALTAHKLACHQTISRPQKDMKPFKKGDKVWLEAKNLSRRYLSNKI